MKLKLRDYQVETIDKLREAYRRGYKRPLLVSPVASGKTVMFAHITEGAAKRGNRVMILVHRKELLEQCSRALLELGVAHGIIAPKYSQTIDHVQVASVGTVIRRLNRIIPPDIIIIDEAHHVAARSWEIIVNHFPMAKLLGVTATPCRLDGKGLANYYDVMVKGPSVQELIAQGFLSQPVVYAPKSEVDLSGLKTRYGDWEKGAIDALMDTPKITGDAVAHYKKICPGVPAIAFCCSIKHAEHTAEKFREAGILSRSVDGTMNTRDREACINGLANGDIHVLTSCEIVSEGTDIPVVGAAILLRPTQSLALYIQQVGRAMRIYPGKKNTYVLDHVGNVYRHGFPDDDREWVLTTKKIKNGNDGEVVNYKQCHVCYAIVPPATKICPQCGSEIPVLGGRDVEEVDGELYRISQREYQMQMWEEYKKLQDKKVALRKSWDAGSVDELKEIAVELGYNPKWAYVRWGQIKKKRGLQSA